MTFDIVTRITDRDKDNIIFHMWKPWSKFLTVMVSENGQTLGLLEKDWLHKWEL